MTTHNTLANQRKYYYAMIRPDSYRVMLSHNVDDLDGRWYHHYHVRGNTLICVPGSLNQNTAPMAVSTWQISDLVLSMQQALANDLIDDATFETIDHTITCMFDGCYVDTDYMCPGIRHPSRMTGLRQLLDELAHSAAWSWKEWLKLEEHMNVQGIIHGYHVETDESDADFMRHIDENVHLVDPNPTVDNFGALLHDEFIIDIDGVADFTCSDVDSELSN